MVDLSNAEGKNATHGQDDNRQRQPWMASAKPPRPFLA
jgi:hypothetical protein